MNYFIASYKMKVKMRNLKKKRKKNIKKSKKQKGKEKTCLWELYHHQKRTVKES